MARSRLAVGRAMSHSLQTGRAIDAVRLALQNQRPAPGLIYHSDRGVQSASVDRRLPAAHGAKPWMNGKGRCLDNAPMEGRHGARTGGARRGSPFGSLETDLVHRARFRPRRQAKAALFEHIAPFYNRQRRPSRIGYRTPEQARSDMTRAKVAP